MRIQQFPFPSFQTENGKFLSALQLFTSCGWAAKFPGHPRTEHTDRFAAVSSTMSFPIRTFILSFNNIFPTFLVLFSDHNAPFAQWSTERVCNWLEDFGLGQYVIFARQWVTSGHTLLTATPQDMEKVISASLYLLSLSNQASPNHWLYLSETHSINFHSYQMRGKEPEARQTLC